MVRPVIRRRPLVPKRPIGAEKPTNFKVKPSRPSYSKIVDKRSGETSYARRERTKPKIQKKPTLPEKPPNFKVKPSRPSYSKIVDKRSGETSYARRERTKPRVNKRDLEREFEEEQNLAEQFEEEEPIVADIRESDSAFSGFSRDYSFPGEDFVDIMPFMEFFRDSAIDVLDERDSIKFRVNVTCQMHKLQNNDVEAFVFSSEVFIRLPSSDPSELYTEAMRQIRRRYEDLLSRGSGWTILNIDRMVIQTDTYTPIGGGLFIPSPKWIIDKRAVVNMEVDDNMCFKWAVARGMFPASRDQGRVTRLLRQQADTLDWSMLEFPVVITSRDITKFEKANNVGISVFGVYKKKTIVILRPPADGFENIVSLLLLTNLDRDYHGLSKDQVKSIKDKHIKDYGPGTVTSHYCVITNLDRLLGEQVSIERKIRTGTDPFSLNHAKPNFCHRCITPFPSQKKMLAHMKYCSRPDAFIPEMPAKGSVTQFKNPERRNRLPTSVYCDFECFTKKTPKKSARGTTERIQTHVPSGFGIKIVHKFGGDYVSYTASNPDEDIAVKYFETLIPEIQRFYTSVLDKRVETKLMTIEQKRDFVKCREKNVCAVCLKLLKSKNVKKENQPTWNIDPFTGEYVGGAIHMDCRIRKIVPRFTPVIFHNLGGYDSKLLVRALNSMKGKVSCLARNSENLISFTKTIKLYVSKDRYVLHDLRFIDSLKFTLVSLQKMVDSLEKSDFRQLRSYTNDVEFECLLKKGIFPYDYMDSFEKLSDKSLPSKEDFYSQLYGKHVEDKDYERAKKVWDSIGCKTMRDYHDFYLMGDVLQLADFMERLRDVCLKDYDLDPLHYYTIPGLALDACLSVCEAKVDQIYDPDQLTFFEKSIRGGMTVVMKRYSKANNKYMPNHDPDKISRFLLYLDINSMYATAMTKPLPSGKLRWMTKDELLDWKSMPCFIQADWEYPDELHDYHKDLTLAPFQTGGKLMATLGPRKEYVTHYVEAKCYLKHGMKITKIHRGVTFEESTWMKPYIDKNVNLRKIGKTKFEKAFYKLMSNSVYGKTIENVRNRSDFKLLSSEIEIRKCVTSPLFRGRSVVGDNLVGVSMAVPKGKMDKPIYVGAAILGISKAMIFDFYYDFMKPMYEDKVTAVYSDTDSLVLEIDTEDVYEDIKPHLHTHFDTSKFPVDHVSGIPKGINEGELGMMKDEMDGDIIEEFVGLRPKMYSMKCLDGSKSVKKVKGISKATMSRISHEDFIHELFNGTGLKKEVVNIRGYGLNQVFTERMTKLALSSDDDKRHIMPNKIDTLPHGHYSIRRKTVVVRRR